MSGARLRVFALACALLTMFTGLAAAPAYGAKPPTVPPSIDVNAVTANPHLFAHLCNGVANITAAGFKGKAPGVWLVRPGGSETYLGAAVKGVATDYSLGSFNDGQTYDPLAFELRDNRGRTIARDELTSTIDCAPGLEIISVDVVPHPTRTGDCSFPITWRPNALPASGVGDIYRKISDNRFVFDGLATVREADLGVTFTEPVTGFGSAMARPADGRSYGIWLEYIDEARSTLGKSNEVTVTATCPPPAE